MIKKTFAALVNETVKRICALADELNLNRDELLRAYAETIYTLANISTIKDYESKRP